MRKESVVLIGFLLLSLAAAPVYGAEIGAGYPGSNDVAPVAESASSGGTIQPNEFGTTGAIILNLGPCDLMPRNPADFASVENLDCQSVGVLSGLPTVTVGAEIHLPNGVLITEATMFFNDTNPNTNPSASINAVSTTGDRTPLLSFDAAQTAGFFFGNTSATVILLTPHTVDNTTNTYHFRADLHRTTPPGLTTQEERIYRVAIKYNRQVHPAPVTAQFSDVPTTHPFFQFVEALAASGITGGCSATAYCPDQAVTRGQMAVFLSTALGLHWPN